MPPKKTVPSQEGLVDYVYEALGCREQQTRYTIARLLDYAVLFDKKQHDYGPENISKFGEAGVVIRLYDKVARLINLSRRDEKPSNEAVEDTWRDVLGYGVIGLMCHRGEWL